LSIYDSVAGAHGPRDRRFRVEHAQHLRPQDIPLFGKLGVISSVQPYHAIDDGRWVEQRIGPVRIKTTYPFRTLLDTGGKLSFGSDWTVAPLDPILGVYAAVTRRTLDGKHPDGWVPEQKITVGEALRAYTAGNAYATFDEAKRGTLAPGGDADSSYWIAISSRRRPIRSIGASTVHNCRGKAGLQALAGVLEPLPLALDACLDHFTENQGVISTR